jgi:hypothetical protein
MMIGKGTAKNLEQLVPKAFLLTINITQSYVGQNPRRQAEKPSSDCLEHGTGQSGDPCHKF